MPTLTTMGAKLHYLKEGSGQPLILLHSLGGSCEMWRRTIDDLKTDFTIIAPDARGHGHSEAMGDISVEQFATDAIAIADALDLDQYGVAGLSMGGQAAMHVAARDQDRVTFLIAADTSLGSASKSSHRVVETRDRIQTIGARAFAFEYTRSRLMPHTSEADVNAFAAMVMDTLPDIYIQQLTSILAQDMRSRVGDILCPTLVIVGANDASTPPKAAQELCQAITGAQLHVIEDANHLSNIDQPAAFNAAMRAFVEKVHCSWQSH